MSVIPQDVIDNWKHQYDEGSALWDQYPEFDADERDKIRFLAARDERIVKDAAAPNPTMLGQSAPLYLATAGAPLAGKSTVLDHVLFEQRPDLDMEAVRVDPDRWGMNYMANLYQGYLMSAGLVANAPDYSYAQKRAYDVARPASNFITLELFNNAASRRSHIVHGTTMTSPHVGGLMQNMKARGYDVELLLCGAPDDMRAQAAEYRANVQGYYQSSPEDVVKKGEEFPKRLKDYFDNADALKLYWRDEVTQTATLAAKFSGGEMELLDPQAFAAFKDSYALKRCHLDGKGESIPSFDDVVEGYKKRFDTAPSKASRHNALRP